MNKQTEYQIIDRVLGGDVQSFSLLIERYKDMVYTLSLKLLKNSHDAEELSQDTFLKAYQKLSQFDKKSKFSTWLYTITYRTGLNILKKNKNKTEELSDGYHQISSDAKSPLALITKEETKEYLRQKIKELRPDDQYVLQLYYFEELSVKEISGIIGHTETNVKSKLFRIRKKLQDLLEPKFKEV